MAKTDFSATKIKNVTVKETFHQRKQKATILLTSISIDKYINVFKNPIIFQ
jgi:hypothetical protein